VTVDEKITMYYDIKDEILYELKSYETIEEFESDSRQYLYLLNARRGFAKISREELMHAGIIRMYFEGKALAQVFSKTGS
jgi:hypothetical protein